MKTKIIIVLIALGIVFSIGATKINKARGSSNSMNIQSSANITNEAIGGLVSEDH